MLLSNELEFINKTRAEERERKDTLDEQDTPVEKEHKAKPVKTDPDFLKAFEDIITQVSSDKYIPKEAKKYFIMLTNQTGPNLKCFSSEVRQKAINLVIKLLPEYSKELVSWLHCAYDLQYLPTP